MKTDQIRDDLLRRIAREEWRRDQSIPTMRDLAKNYDSSTVTVQKVIRELCSEGILESRHRQGVFISNGAAAGQLLSQKIDAHFAFVLPRWIQGGTANPSYSEVLNGAEIQAAESQVKLIYSSLPWARDVGDFSGVEPLFAPGSVSGILMVGPAPVNVAEHFVRVHQVPVVFVDNVVDIASAACVSSDNLGGGIRATEYLLRRGHRRIGMVAMDPQKLRVNERLAGFYAEMHRCGLLDQIAFIEQAQWDMDTADGGYQVGCRLAKQGLQGATAILTINDTMAMGVMRAFHEHGISVPDDVSIMGIGDEPGAAIARPALTTMHVDRMKLGRMGVEILLDVLYRKRGMGEIRLLPMALVERQSVADGPTGDDRVSEILRGSRKTVETLISRP